MAKVAILGTGMIGSTMAIDLARESEHEVLIADRDESALKRAADHVRAVTGVDVATSVLDLSEAKNISAIARDADILSGALPSPMGFQALRAVIETGKPFVDISFMTEDPFELDDLARKNGVTAIVDCGIAPGMSNLFAGHVATEMDRCDSIDIYVGGLPRERVWPFEYKAGFAPTDVIEEYTRPVRIRERGKTVVREALSEPERVDFSNVPGLGTLEAINTDGLRTLLTTLKVPDIREKTLRYAGHAELMRIFRASGFFREDEIEVNGARIRPVDVTSALVFPMWSFREGEADLTIMRVIARGSHNGKPAEWQWELYDGYDPEWNCSSMSRVTAFPAATVARMILAGKIDRPGVLPPERLAEAPGLVDEIVDALRERGLDIAFRHQGADAPARARPVSAS